MQPYDIMAPWYDLLMEDVPYEAWAETIERLLAQNGSAPKRILEFASGTGLMTGLLLEQGHWVTAVERSEAMLQEAQATLGSQGGRLKLIAGDMTEFTTRERYDAVISVCDGFNYLTSREALADMLRRCVTLCNPGALILFDISSDWKFRHQLHDRVIAESHEDMAFIWENAYDAESRLLTFELTFFIKEGSLFRREMEQHLQRAHDPAEIAEICETLGLQQLGIYDGYSGNPAKEDSERLLFAMRVPTTA